MRRKDEDGDDLYNGRQCWLTLVSWVINPVRDFSDLDQYDHGDKEDYLRMSDGNRDEDYDCSL